MLIVYSGLQALSFHSDVSKVPKTEQCSLSDNNIVVSANYDVTLIEAIVFNHAVSAKESIVNPENVIFEKNLLVSLVEYDPDTPDNVALSINYTTMTSKESAINPYLILSWRDNMNPNLCRAWFGPLA